jgi:hypothetical protein
MAYIGATPANTFQSLTSQTLTGDGGTSYTLNTSVSTAADIAVFVNNVRQNPNSSYSASGTTLSMSAAVSSSDGFYVVYLGKAVGTINPASGSVGSSTITAEMITGQTELTSPADTDEVLISDSGVLKRADVSTIGEKNEIYWATYGSTDQTNLTNNTITTVVYNNVRSQSSHNGYDTSTGKFTVPSGGEGIYDISGMATIGGTGTANNHVRSVYNWIYINASNGRARAGNFLTANYYEGTQGSNSPVRLIYPLVAGDTVEIKAQAYGNDHSIDHSTNLSFFGGFRVLAGTFSVG